MLEFLAGLILWWLFYITGHNFLKFWMWVILLKEFFTKTDLPQSFLFLLYESHIYFLLFFLSFLISFFISLLISSTSFFSYRLSPLASITPNLYFIIFNNYFVLPNDISPNPYSTEPLMSRSNTNSRWRIQTFDIIQCQCGNLILCYKNPYLPSPTWLGS